MPRLFEQTENNDPDLSNRFAFGKAATATGNMTLTNFLTWIFGKLNFLKSASNLSDLSSATTSRTNLGVYSKAQVDSAVNAKLSAYPTAGGGLRVTNTTLFTPTTDHHPATKKYVDDRDERILKGTYHVGDIGSGSTAVTITHNKGNQNYVISIALVTPNAQAGDDNINMQWWRILQRNDNTFTMTLYETAGQVQDVYIDWVIFPTD